MLVELLHELGQVFFGGHMVQTIHYFCPCVVIYYFPWVILVGAVTLEECGQPCPAQITLFVLFLCFGVLLLLQCRQPFRFLLLLLLVFNLLLHCFLVERFIAFLFLLVVFGLF